jgi:hypothetical protein
MHPVAERVRGVVILVGDMIEACNDRCFDYGTMAQSCLGWLGDEVRTTSLRGSMAPRLEKPPVVFPACEDLEA